MFFFLLNALVILFCFLRSYSHIKCICTIDMNELNLLFVYVRVCMCECMCAFSFGFVSVSLEDFPPTFGVFACRCICVCMNYKLGIIVHTFSFRIFVRPHSTRKAYLCSSFAFVCFTEGKCKCLCVCMSASLLSFSSC